MTLTPVLPRTLRSRLAWAITDAWVITCRDLAHWTRQPGAVIANTLLFPVMIVLMFGYLLGGAMTVPGGGNYRDFLMPGMFAMTMVFGTGATLSAVSADAARGVTDRFRAMPMAAPAVITGRAAADMLNSAAALAVLTGCGFGVGWHPHRGAARAIAALGLLLLLRFAFVWIGVYLGLRFYPNPGAVTAVRTLEFPSGSWATRSPPSPPCPHGSPPSHSGTRYRQPPRPPASSSAIPPGPTPPGSQATPSSWQSPGRCCSPLSSFRYPCTVTGA